MMTAARHMRSRAALYFDVVDPAARPAIVAAAQAVAAPAEARLAARIGDDLMLPHQRLMATSPRPFDYAYQLADPAAASPAALEASVAAFADALGPLLDRRRCTVLVGREVAITTGDGPVYVIMTLRRLPTIDHAEFMRHWFDRHAALGAGIAGVRYRQNHVDAARTAGLALRLGLPVDPLDGVTDSYYDDLASARAILSGPAVAVDALADEKRFIDHARSRFGLYEDVWRAAG
jgi:hypothetical protein